MIICVSRIVCTKAGQLRVRKLMVSARVDNYVSMEWKFSIECTKYVVVKYYRISRRCFAVEALQPRSITKASPFSPLSHLRIHNARQLTGIIRTTSTTAAAAIH